jgi:hypothetical protein
MDPADGNDLTRVVRTSSRNRNAVKRDRQPFVKLEPTFGHGHGDGDEDDDDEGEDEDENEGKMSYCRDDDDVMRGIDQDGASGSGEGEMKGYHFDGEVGAYDIKPVSVAKGVRGGSNKPARTTKVRTSRSVS